ncbi:MAG: NAD(P)/FAD-dependent oxidoreductase, partial [Wenzhouxiangella sp.]
MKTDVAVVGAGWAGLTAASHLATRGHSVMVVEKARGPGGRSATRREGSLAFDHGAQYFTARTDAFARQVRAWSHAGLADAWRPRIEVFGNRPEAAGSGPETRWVGVPGMNAILHRFAAGLDCRYRWPVRALFHDGCWTLVSEDDERLQAEVVLLTAPPAQAAALLGPHHALAERLGQVVMEPCWALMLAFDEPVDPGFDAAFVNDGSLAWVACNSAKPGRKARPQSWVVHAASDFSNRNLEREEGAVADELLAALAELDDAFAARPRVCLAHRWRHARAVDALREPLLAEDRSSLVLAGDWCAGNRIEGA